MVTLSYQVVVQWSPTNSRFEAYSPTLMTQSIQLAPDFPRVAYGDSIVEAVENYEVLADKFLALLKKLAILPPPADVGPAVEETVNEEILGKVVL